MHALTRCAAAFAAFTAFGSCRSSHDVTPMIHVEPRAARRIDWFARAKAPAETAAPARVHEMKRGEELGGPNAIGRPGDLMLENDEVVFVIDRLGSSSGFAESGGNIVDAADAQGRKDELGQMFTYFGVFPRQAVYETISTGRGPDGSAWVEAKGRELYESKLAVTTRYTLRAPDRALSIETTLENQGALPVGGLSLGDAIQWGGAEKMAPGKPRGFKGPSSGPYIGGIGRFASYAVTSTDGAIDGVSGSTWTDTAQRAGVSLGSGQKITYSRVLIVGERPDSASLVSELARSAGQTVGAIAVTLSLAGGESRVETPPDARVAARSTRGGEVLSIHASGSPPRLHALLPPGHYVLSYAGGGGRAGIGAADVDVAADDEARAAIAVTSAAALRVLCVDGAKVSMPCKVTFERLDGGAIPDFGPAHAAGPARNQATTADGVVEVSLEPGGYRVTASRGPEFDLARSDVLLGPGESKEARLSPRRVVDTTGYLACDFHQHTMLGADAPVSVRDRVISNGAEGVEVAVATEHNVVADLEPVVRALHLERVLVSIPGDELTSDASRHPWGHANAWPLRFDPEAPRGGAPAVRDRSAREAFDDLRRTSRSDFVIQVNHPRSGQNGYFDLLGFDPATGAAASAEYDSRFDALEIWNGRNIEARSKVLTDFFGLLRASHPITATADTDTHGIVGQEAGYPRTYVRVGDDGPLDPWSAERTADVVHGVKTLRDVVLTNGPMLRVSAGQAPIGGVARGHVVVVKVHVESAPWVVVDELRLLRASTHEVAEGKDGGAPTSLIGVDEKPNAAGALAADAVFTVRAAVDDAFVVVASGHKAMTPVLSASGGPGAVGANGDIVPWAMTGAIWIDADGDGEALGR